MLESNEIVNAADDVIADSEPDEVEGPETDDEETEETEE